MRPHLILIVDMAIATLVAFCVTSFDCHRVLQVQSVHALHQASLICSAFFPHVLCHFVVYCDTPETARRVIIYFIYSGVVHVLSDHRGCRRFLGVAHITLNSQITGI